MGYSEAVPKQLDGEQKHSHSELDEEADGSENPDMNMSLEGEDMVLQKSKEPNLCQKIGKKLDKFMIKPDHKKLKIFHIILAFSLFIDIFITSFLIGNYNMFIDESNSPEHSDFLLHEEIYTYLMII